MEMLEIYEGVDLSNVARQMAGFANYELGYLGAAVVNYAIVVNKEKEEVLIRSGEYVTRLSRIPEPDNPQRGKDDKGTDYLAIAKWKAARRLRMEIGIDTGEPLFRRGESKVGGDAALRYPNSEYLITSFSGTPTPEEDTRIANFGIEKFIDAATNVAWDRLARFVLENNPLD